MRDSIEQPEAPLIDPALLQSQLERYAVRYPGAFQILRVGGVDPKHTSVIKNPYLPGAPDDHEDFSNVGRHCVAIANFAEKLALKLDLDSSIVDITTQRALVHDANKRYEVMRKKAARQGALSADAVYTHEAYEAIRELLSDSGIPRELLDYLACAGKETGHTSLKDFLVLLPGRTAVGLNEDRTLAEKIVHIADDMTYSRLPHRGEDVKWEQTSYVPCDERMRLSDFPRRYPNLYIGGLGFDPNDGSLQETTDIGINGEYVSSLFYFDMYAYWQAMTARMICRELQKTIDPANRQDPELFICDIVRD